MEWRRQNGNEKNKRMKEKKYIYKNKEGNRKTKRKLKKKDKAE